MQKHLLFFGAGDMMHLLRKYDVARFTRNDAMFAIKCGEATHHSRS